MTRPPPQLRIEIFQIVYYCSLSNYVVLEHLDSLVRWHICTVIY